MSSMCAANVAAMTRPRSTIFLHIADAPVSPWATAYAHSPPEPNISIAYTHHIAQQPPTASPPQSLTFSCGPTILHAPRTPTIIIWRTRRQPIVPNCVYLSSCAFGGNSHLDLKICAHCSRVSNMACILSNMTTARSSKLCQYFLQYFSSLRYSRLKINYTKVRFHPKCCSLCIGDGSGLLRLCRSSKSKCRK